MRILFASAILVLADQISKFVIRNNMNLLKIELKNIKKCIYIYLYIYTLAPIPE